MECDFLQLKMKQNAFSYLYVKGLRTVACVLVGMFV